MGINIGPQIAETKANQHFFLGVHGIIVVADQMLRLIAWNPNIKIAIFRFGGRTVQCRDGARKEAVAFFRVHVADAAEIVQTVNLQGKVRRRGR